MKIERGKKSVKVLSLSLVFFVQLLAASTSSSETGANVNWLQTNKKVLEQHILPRYEHLAEKTYAFLQLTQQECVSDDVKADDIDSWQRSYKELSLSWAAIQHIRFGPITYEQRFERIQYWPDKHNRGGRQLQQLLNQNIKQMSLEQLSNKSVAVQGITALERLLFTDAGVLNEQACQLVVLIAQNLDEMAVQNIVAWTRPPVSFAREFLLVGNSLSVFSSSQELAGKLLADLRTQLAIVESLKLSRALPTIKGKLQPKPKRLEAWRSRQSLALITANLNSIRQLYQLGFAEHLHKSDNSLAEQVSVSFDRVFSLIDHFDIALYELYADENNQSQLVNFIAEVKQLRLLLGEQMPRQLAMGVSFNSLDGD
ncbi:MAG: imelysin family protein [Arenicella sp.]